jgi:NAD(P)-dependent dehydrogenase (short-subunit alcohol dehydrogenase family)
MYNFEDKVVLVVGSSRGIGRGVYNEFIHKGADVFGINTSNCDISKKEDIDKWFSDFESVDILVNVAAINYSNKIEDVSFDEWDEVLDVNLRGYYYIIKKTLDIMPDGGKIVNVSSIAGRHRSYTSGVHYTASKAGIIGLTKQVAFEVAGRGINVNAVCPSQTKTDMLLKTVTEEEIKKLEEVIPMGRLAEIDEVVNPIVFLCSDGASYITGTTIDINGGQL